MPRVDDYKAALALVVSELKKAEPREVAGRSQAEYCGEGSQQGLVLPYFGQERRVWWPDIRVEAAPDWTEPSLTEQILILHYLHQATGEPLSGRSIDFRQVPGGSFYWSAFVSRAKKPLLQVFGQDLELYRKVAEHLGGTLLEEGDAAAAFPAFPLVPVTHVLWRGDEEFPPDANILFDQTIIRHLPTEDIAALAGNSVYRLMGAARGMGKK